MDNKISVLIITYNQEKTIARTIDSIISQKTNYDFEIIIGDDCSTDNTPNILRDYEKKDSRIKCLYNKVNLGPVNNYFHVLSHCNGEYIMECAGDDYWLGGKIQKQVEIMDSNPNIGLLYGKAKILRGKDEESIIGEDKKTFKDLIKENRVPALTVCLRNELVRQYISEVDPVSKNWLMEDYPMWLWFSKKTKLLFVDQVFGVYTIANNSVSHSTDINKAKNFIDSIFDVAKYFAEDCEDYKNAKKYYSYNLQKLYLQNNEFVEYRKCLLQPFSLKNIFKYIISTTKNGKRLLISRTKG